MNQLHSLRPLLSLVFSSLFLLTAAQQRPEDELALLREMLVQEGFFPADLEELEIRDAYTSAHNGVRHTFLRQHWQGIEVFNGDIALHRAADGRLLRMNNRAWKGIAKMVNATEPAIDATAALRAVLEKTRPGKTLPRPLESDADGRVHRFDGSALGSEPVEVRLCFVPVGDSLRLAWNVNHYTPDGTHWWNVRIDAMTGAELERNDWVSQCDFGHEAHGCTHEAAPAPEDLGPPTPASPNDYHVYALPEESPSHGSRTLQNAPWTDGGIASPFGWHDTDGVAGSEHTDTRGNNCRAQEDQDANNSGGYRPDGGLDLDFDFPIDLAQPPTAYQDALITNLFYWNNVIHDVWYQYGFDEVSGNFQQNNYGRGGAEGDFVWADALDGSGTNNANFGTPPDGSNPRMQMFVWTQTSPHRTSDLDNGVIAHEYGHGISNRLVAGPSNVNCLFNAEQMGEGWSDYLGLVMTMKPGDTGPSPRGIGTYVLGQPTSGGGIRPAPYSTSFGVNNFTYAATNSGSISQPHGIGFIWCTMLWEMTWELIDAHGFDPDIYNGTGGNNIAMQLVIDGLKLTPCQPGFVDGRDAILLADQINNAGANQTLIWAAFARRGLGASADQGSSTSRTDQVEAFDMPVDNNVGVAAILAPTAGDLLACDDTPIQVTARIRNFGLDPQANFPLGYTLDNGTPVTQIYPGTLDAGASVEFTFDIPLTITGLGPHTVEVFTALPGDEFVGDDISDVELTLIEGVTVDAPYVEGLEVQDPEPAGWNIENPDNSTTWLAAQLAAGPQCDSTFAWVMDHYYYNSSGQEDRLVTPLVDLSSSALPKLTFDHAYRAYSSFYADAFRLDISADCGASWQELLFWDPVQLATGTPVTSPWTPANCSDWQHNEIDLEAYDGQTVLLRFVAINGYGNRMFLDNVAIESNGVRLALKLMLEGPYDPGTDRMRDDLRSAGSIPMDEPYSSLGYVQVGGGGEVQAAGLMEITGDDAPVDWVLVELRDALDPGVVVATRNALLQRDGDVVMTNGTEQLLFAAPPGDHFVAVRHRNHLGCMTAGPIALSTEAVVLDLTQPAVATFGTDARILNNGRMLLRAGNVLNTGAIKYTGSENDRDAVLNAIGGAVPTATTNGYLEEDVNMDGQVKYTGTENDRDRILQAVGGSVPTATRTEQLP